MRLTQLGRELEVPDHDMWLLAAGLLRGADWPDVFDHGIVLTTAAEQAIRDHVDGLYEALGR